jgi:hypothetical protein
MKVETLALIVRLESKCLNASADNQRSNPTWENHERLFAIDRRIGALIGRAMSEFGSGRKKACTDGEQESAISRLRHAPKYFPTNFIGLPPKA